MNIFMKETDIFGKYSPNKDYGAFKKFFKLTRKVKKKLGTDSYKLDQYLNILLKSLNFEFNANAAMEGSTAYRELRGICLSILNFEENYQNHEFYQVAKKFIENNNFKYKEKHTLLEIYCALLTPKFTDFTVKKYINKIKQQSSAVLDIIELRQLYEHLSSIVGQQKIDALNSAIMESFLFCPVIKSFLQSITNHYLLCLLYRDAETSKQIFQLITDL